MFSIFGVEHYAAVMYVQCVIDLCTCLLMLRWQGDCLGHRPR